MCWSWWAFFRPDNTVHGVSKDDALIRSYSQVQESLKQATTIKSATITCSSPIVDSHPHTMDYPYHSRPGPGNSIHSSPQFPPIKSRRRTTSDKSSIHVFTPIENPPASFNQPRRATVLLVDDAPVNQTIGTKMLHKLGMCVRIAHDGEDAIRQIRESYWLDSPQPAADSTLPSSWHPGLLRTMSTPSQKQSSSRATPIQEPVDLVLMDRNMPIKDGITATREIRELEATAAWKYGRLPIIACTTDSSESCLSGFTDAGADDFLHKPYKFDGLREMLEKHLCLGRSSKEMDPLENWEWK